MELGLVQQLELRILFVCIAMAFFHPLVIYHERPCGNDQDARDTERPEIATTLLGGAPPEALRVFMAYKVFFSPGVSGPRKSGQI